MQPSDFSEGHQSDQLKRARPLPAYSILDKLNLLVEVFPVGTCRCLKSSSKRCSFRPVLSSSSTRIDKGSQREPTKCWDRRPVLPKPLPFLVLTANVRTNTLLQFSVLGHLHWKNLLSIVASLQNLLPPFNATRGKLEKEPYLILQLGATKS